MMVSFLGMNKHTPTMSSPPMLKRIMVLTAFFEFLACERLIEDRDFMPCFNIRHSIDVLPLTHLPFSPPGRRVLSPASTVHAVWLDQLNCCAPAHRVLPAVRVRRCVLVSGVRPSSSASRPEAENVSNS